MAYVYQHRRLDTNEIFYIGISNTNNFKRAYYKYNRNKIWKDIVNKTNYIVEILAENLTWIEACFTEIVLIGIYGRKDLKNGTLSNLTDGGEGVINLTIDSKEKIRQASIIRNNLPYYKEKLIARNKSFIWTKEIIDRMNNTKKVNDSFCKGHSDETKLKISKLRSKKVINIETGEIYESAKQCALENNILPKTLVNYLSGHRKNKTNFKYLINGN